MRLEITRRADLAIRALALLGTSSERLKASALADELGTTVAFVPQVLGPEADTHLHIHKENNVLFPMVVRLEAERAAVSAG